jgi:hypothetical protein
MLDHVVNFSATLLKDHIQLVLIRTPQDSIFSKIVGKCNNKSGHPENRNGRFELFVKPVIIF